MFSRVITVLRRSPTNAEQDCKIDYSNTRVCNLHKNALAQVYFLEFSIQLILKLEPEGLVVHIFLHSIACLALK